MSDKSDVSSIGTPSSAYDSSEERERQRQTPKGKRADAGSSDPSDLGTPSSAYDDLSFDDFSSPERQREQMEAKDSPKPGPSRQRDSPQPGPSRQRDSPQPGPSHQRDSPQPGPSRQRDSPQPGSSDHPVESHPDVPLAKLYQRPYPLTGEEVYERMVYPDEEWAEVQIVGEAGSREKFPEWASDQFFYSQDALEYVLGLDVYTLRGYVQANFSKIMGYDFLTDRIVRLMKEYGPRGIYLDKRANPGTLIGELRRMLEESRKKWALFDVSMQDLGILGGSRIKAMIGSSKDRISEVLDGAFRRASEAEERFEAQLLEKLSLEGEIAQLQLLLKRAQEYIRELKGEHLFDPPPTDEEFVRGLNMELELQENLNSSLNEDIARERITNKKLHQELMEIEGRRVQEHNFRMEELAKAAKDVEVNNGIRNAIANKIKTLTPKPEDAIQAVNEWMNTVTVVLKEKEEAIQKKTSDVKDLDDKIAEKQLAINEQLEKIEELDNDILKVKMRRKNKYKRIAQLEDDIKTLESRIEGLEQFYRDTAAKADKQSDRYYKYAVTDTFRSLPVSPRGPAYDWAPRRLPPSPPRDSSEHFSDDSPSPKRTPRVKGRPLIGITEDPRASPEMISRAIGSPQHYPEMISRMVGSSPSSPRDQQGSGPHSRQSTPFSSPSSTEPSPYNLQVPSPGMQGRVGGVAPGTQTLSRPPSAFAPEIGPVCLSTQTISAVTNRIDVGDSFNMRTMQSGTSFPYRQVTRVDSSLSDSGSPRMSDRPLNIRHRAELTPNQCETPFISTTRFGYTDPTARVLNLPPGPGFDVSAGLRKTLVLTSPRSQEPLLVNIDIDPKPLTEAEDGEHFICDISLDLQKASAQQQRALSPVYTYDEPPAVTPTSARKYGLFTPRGIFQKKHYNVRRVYWPDEYQSPDLPWSPHDLPDATSPISGLFPSPHISDASISWERAPDSPYSAALDRTFNVSPHDAMNRTYEVSPPAAMDKTFVKSPSPVIKGAHYGTGYQSSDTEGSMSPAIKGPHYGTGYQSSDTESSMSPVIKGAHYGTGYRSSDRTSDDSPAHGVQTAGLDRTFERSPSPLIKGPSWRRSHFTRQDAVDRNAEPVIPGPSYRSHALGLGLDRTYDRDASRESDRTSDSRKLLSSKGTSDKSSTPSSGGSKSYQISGSNGSFSSGYPSSQAGSSYKESLSSEPGSSYSGSPQFQLNRSYDRSKSPQLNQSFSKGQSSQMNGTHYPEDTSQSYAIPDYGSGTSYRNRAFEKSPHQQSSRGGEGLLNQAFRETSSQENKTFYAGTSAVGKAFDTGKSGVGEQFNKFL